MSFSMMQEKREEQNSNTSVMSVQVWSGQPWVLGTWTASRGSTTRWWSKPKTWPDREEGSQGPRWLTSLSLMSTITLPASLRVRHWKRRDDETLSHTHALIMELSIKGQENGYVFPYLVKYEQFPHRNQMQVTACAKVSLWDCFS